VPCHVLSGMSNIERSHVSSGKWGRMIFYFGRIKLHRSVNVHRAVSQTGPSRYPHLSTRYRITSVLAGHIPKNIRKGENMQYVILDR
jgi:hypothetical protein